jgi:tetratricopeptide (TPR) repeat protein
MAYVDLLRARVDESRAGGGQRLAIALIELAEAEPLFGHRQAAVRGPLEQVASLLDPLGEPALEGRTLLRLAHVKLSEGDLEAVEQLADRARARLEPAGEPDRWIEAGTLSARAAIRRHQFDEAQTQLADLGDALGEPETVTARRAVAGLALAWAELAVEQQQYSEAEARIAVLAEGIADDPTDELVEAHFACCQVRGAVALAMGDNARACHALREAVGIARRVGAAVEDELETRIALAGALVQRDDHIGREEAERHLQIARDKALEHGLDSMHLAALIGQAGLLAQKGQTQAALARCVEIASIAVSKQDLLRYSVAVALMSQIYEQKDDLASAYRTFAEAHASLRDKLGDQATELFRPHLAAFANRIGYDKFAEVAEQVNRAAHARQTYRRST